MASGGDQEWPANEIIDVGFVDSKASLTVMCNLVRFDISVDADDLGSSCSGAVNPIAQEFSYFQDNYDEEVEAFGDWATIPCLPFFKKLAPAPEAYRTFTLDDYYQPPIHLLRLKSVNGALTAEEYQSETGLHEALRPRLSIFDPRLASDAFKTLLKIPASELKIVRDPELMDFELCAIPRVVSHGQLGPKLAFKALVDEESFFRELNVYLASYRTKGKDLIPLPILNGLVTLSDNTILGFILEYIENIGTLQYHADSASKSDRERWYRQIEKAVGGLHDSGWFWGDVKPDNVLIGLDGNAHIIDFGGGSTEEWVDRSLAGTKQGDIQGLERIKDFLSQ